MTITQLTEKVVFLYKLIKNPPIPLYLREKPVPPLKKGLGGFKNLHEKVKHYYLHLLKQL